MIRDNPVAEECDSIMQDQHGWIVREETGWTCAVCVELMKSMGVDDVNQETLP
jgi:hypothetical protein